MKKILIAFAILLHVEASETITKEDILLLQDFAPTVYKKAKETPKEQKIARALRFLLEKMTFRIDYQKLKIEAVATTGRRTAKGSEEGTNTGIFPSDFNYYNVGLKATYPLLDDKEKREIEKAKISFKMSVIDDLKEFMKARAEEHAESKTIEILELKLTRAKARTMEGIIALDDRIAIMEKLAEATEKKAVAEIEKQAKIEKLLTYLDESYHAEFLEILE